MPRSRFLRSAPLAVFFLGVPILGACGGHVLSIGTNGSQLQAISPSEVSGNAGACPTGYAHPNVCCEDVAGQPAQCGAWIEHPFQACDPGWKTYPNPLSCCSLTNDKDCIDTPSDAGVPAPPPYGCGYTCPPGYYVPPGVKLSPGEGECCMVGPDGAEACFGWATASPGTTVNGAGGPDQPPCAIDAGPAPVPPSCACACPANDPSCTCDCDAGPAPDAGDADAGPIDVDGGTGGCPGDDAGPPPPPYDGGPYGLCGQCPDGWSSDPSTPDLCCRLDPDGITECFSQATGPISGPPKPVPPPVDAGPAPNPPPMCSGSGGGTPNGGTTSETCSCIWENNNQKQAIDCSLDASGNTTCFCTVDGKSVGQLTPGPVCADPAKVQGLYASCFGTNP